MTKLFRHRVAKFFGTQQALSNEIWKVAGNAITGAGEMWILTLIYFVIKVVEGTSFGSKPQPTVMTLSPICYIVEVLCGCN